MIRGGRARPGRSGCLVFGLAMLVVAGTPLQSEAQQAFPWSEATVGSEWSLYARALAARGRLGDEPWSIRPFSPVVLGRWSALTTGNHPWADRLRPREGSGSRFRVLRPSVELSDNTDFAWGFNDGPVWQGRGMNAWGTAGVIGRWGHLSLRLEPLFEYAQNAAFRLDPLSPGAPNPYLDDLRPSQIDLPQRMGSRPYLLLAPGESYIRLDVRSFGIGLSTQELFWGPGVRNALLFGPNAGGFPHLFLGTNQAVGTPLGRFSTRIVYGRLEQTPWAPPSVNSERLGGGLIFAWQPPSTPLTLGFARFYHRSWPRHWTKSDYLLPLGAFFSRPQASGTGVADNQLFSMFASFRAPSVGLEIFGEFGKNDRNADLRDLAVEPESNSAWLVGFFKVMGLDSSRTDMWTIRGTVANGSVASLQSIGRGQATFYEHGNVTQGHTERGQLLGTPLINRSWGINIAVDRFTDRGRLGISLMERQMPPDLQVGMPANQVRTQWDLGIGGVVFRGRSDITVQLGHVWDLNRFPDRDMGNTYVRLGTRFAPPF